MAKRESVVHQLWSRDMTWRYGSLVCRCGATLRADTLTSEDEAEATCKNCLRCVKAAEAAKEKP